MHDSFALIHVRTYMCNEEYLHLLQTCSLIVFGQELVNTLKLVVNATMLCALGCGGSITTGMLLSG